jgi:hypothetical protein
MWLSLGIESRQVAVLEAKNVLREHFAQEPDPSMADYRKKRLAENK